MKQLKAFFNWLSPGINNDECAQMVMFVVSFIFHRTEEEKKIALVGYRKFGIFILKFCAIIVVPLITVITIIKLIQIYFIVLLLICWAGHSIYKRYHSDRLAALNSVYMSNMSTYSDIAGLVLNPIKSLTKWLDFAEPHNAESLINYPQIISKGNMSFFAYKVLKLSHDKTEESDLAFAESQLQSLINDKLTAENLRNPTFPSMYYDMPVLIVHEIEDMGNHFKVLLIYVNNDAIYNFVVETSKYRTNATTTTIAALTDEDF
ncbi:hypothetical protein M6D81_31410 [Paenibacillus sp. J5C_2022]|uniref:hypothetical protein n=1 Tax=Paenibacillus sp. J5C2022 TaxID=2977129 RepID=UPI0021D353E1|nr:hypothetical protein [Paenibacillus sp. J5C2022]MCU6713215.1 hypothetical protein [Paenibacillus sp. J5C2022]